MYIVTARRMQTLVTGLSRFDLTNSHKAKFNPFESSTNLWADHGMLLLKANSEASALNPSIPHAEPDSQCSGKVSEHVIGDHGISRFYDRRNINNSLLRRPHH